MLKCLALIFFINLGFSTAKAPEPNCDQICGKWMSAENNLSVEVYKSGDEFKAKIVWFKEHPHTTMEEWPDKNNPDPALRTRKVLGMDVLSDLKYNASSKSWEDGTIYDAQSGHEWSASAYIDNKGLLKVKGYWHFKIFGKTMTFKKA
jgi:uncharacterized protein (DUF2147 family)